MLKFLFIYLFFIIIIISSSSSSSSSSNSNWFGSWLVSILLLSLHLPQDEGETYCLGREDVLATVML